MIPAIWGGWKAASLGWKLGTTIGPLLLLGLVFGWGLLVGKDGCEDAHTEEMLAQSMDVTKHTEQKAEALASVADKHEDEYRSPKVQSEVIHHEVIKYIEVAKPVDLEPRYVDLVNRIRELQRESENRVSETDLRQEIEKLRANEITSNQLLRGYEAIARARQRDLEMIDYAKTFDDVRYKEEMAFYEKLPREARDRED